MATANHSRTTRKPARLGPAPALRSARPDSSTPVILAALLYGDWSDLYTQSFNQNDVKYNLAVGYQLPASGVRAHQTLYFCAPQRRYTQRGQCGYILHSKAVEGKKEFFTGLRDVTTPAAFPLGVRLFVGDYKADRHGNGPAHTAVVLEGKPEGNRPGWLLVVVVDKPYRRRGACANAETAKAAALTVLPQLPGLLAKLPLEELQAA